MMWMFSRQAVLTKCGGGISQETGRTASSSRTESGINKKGFRMHGLQDTIPRPASGGYYSISKGSLEEGLRCCHG